MITKDPWIRCCRWGASFRCTILFPHDPFQLFQRTSPECCDVTAQVNILFLAGNAFFKKLRIIFTEKTRGELHFLVSNTQVLALHNLNIVLNLRYCACLFDIFPCPLGECSKQKQTLALDVFLFRVYKRYIVKIPIAKVQCCLLYCFFFFSSFESGLLCPRLLVHWVEESQTRC